MATLSDLGAQDNPVLKDIIAGRIEKAGPIPFSEFMELALYHPVHGYYFACDPTRDYQSSPEVHPVFGAMLARALRELWLLLDRPERLDVIEAGAGPGRLAAAILRWLGDHDPELSEALRYVLQDLTYSDVETHRRLERAGVPLDRVDVRGELSDPGTVHGVILSNELLDSFPFHRVRVRDGRLQEVRVGLEGGRFVDVETEATAAVSGYFEALGFLPGEGCDAEVNLAAPAWVCRASDSMARGYLLTLDYGYRASELYAPWRKQGTLLTFYRHTSGDDPYSRVGRQDITASVDFTTIARAGREAGLQPVAFTAQSLFLSDLGAGEALAQQPGFGQFEDFYALRRAAIELMDPAGLGRVRVLLQGKSVPETRPPGFRGAGQVDL